MLCSLRSLHLSKVAAEGQRAVGALCIKRMSAGGVGLCTGGVYIHSEFGLNNNNRNNKGPESNIMSLDGLVNAAEVLIL